jgi:hypothetical protein
MSTVEGFAGHWVLSANRNEDSGRPTVIDGKRNPLVAADGKIYSGCRCNFIVDIWAQVKDYPGIRCTLSGVQFRADDEAFSGAVKAKADDFDEVDDGADADDLV